MSKQLAIYLAGNIQKGHEDTSRLAWTQDHLDFLSQEVAAALTFLNPALRSDDLSDQRSVFGRDMLQVYSSDLILVDARERRGLGVGAEMMWAKMNRLPVIIWAPKNSHYHKEQAELLGVEIENWVHPFVESLADHLAEDLPSIVAWIVRFLDGTISSIKGPEDIEGAMRYYLEQQFGSDLPMQEAASANDSLREKFLLV